jgi:ribosomal protein L7/L12
MADVQWSTLDPILRDLTDRIIRIEQHLASTGFQAASQANVQDSFGAAPASFGAQESFSGTPGQPGPTGSGVPADLIALARAGKLIVAIKQYKDMTGVSLKEAKDAIEVALSRGY